MGEHVWLLGAPFGSLGVTLWAPVGPEGDSVGFWEAVGFHFESFWGPLGVIWDFFARLLSIDCGFLAETCAIMKMHENLHKIDVFRRF